ncbi:MAG: cadherin repeat domain-containing protein, partial [Pseudomonadota bacterium]
MSETSGETETEGAAPGEGTLGSAETGAGGKIRTRAPIVDFDHAAAGGGDHDPVLRNLQTLHRADVDTPGQGVADSRGGPMPLLDTREEQSDRDTGTLSPSDPITAQNGVPAGAALTGREDDRVGMRSSVNADVATTDHLTTADPETVRAPDLPKLDRGSEQSVERHTEVADQSGPAAVSVPKINLTETADDTGDPVSVTLPEPPTPSSVHSAVQTGHHPTSIQALQEPISPVVVSRQDPALFTPEFEEGLPNQTANTSPQVSIDTGPVAETAAAGTVVARLAATDPDHGDTLSFRLLDADGAPLPDDLFTLDGDLVRLAPGAALDFETSPAHSLTVEVADTAGNTRAQSVTINVSDVNEGPATLSIDTGPVAETAAAGTVVARLA